MKRTILIPVILLGLGHLPEAVGQNTDTVIPGVSVENSNMNREGKYLAVEINLDINKLDVDANRTVLLTPRLVNGILLTCPRWEFTGAGGITITYGTA